MPNNVSIATENFIKTIYKFGQSDAEDTRPGSIARELGISNAAATDMARKLSQRKLIHYEKYKAIHLTASGEKMALDILRKHRLWETFLHEVLGLSMHEIHREAELLEHLTSDFLAEKISTYLGHPTTDPHGDPIPNKNGVIEVDEDSSTLNQALTEGEYEIVRLSGSQREFFEFCHAHQIRVGNKILIHNRYMNNSITEVSIHATKLVLSEDLTHLIHVKKTIE